MTHWTLANGTGVEIVNIVDDHSRLCLASVVLPVTKAVDVERIFRTQWPNSASGVGVDRQRRHLHGQVPGREGGVGERA